MRWNFDNDELHEIVLHLGPALAASTMRTGRCGGLVQPFCDAMFVEDNLTTPQDQQFFIQVVGLLHANETGMVIRDEGRDKTRLELKTLDGKTRDEDILLHNILEVLHNDDQGNSRSRRILSVLRDSIMNQGNSGH